MDAYLKLAKETIEAFVKEGRIISPPKGLPIEMLNSKAGVFVSLHLKDGSLRGCIGTFAPTRKNIAEEIIYNAISSATQDPRFPPVKKKELEKLIFSVDVLSASKSVSKDKLSDPKKYGLIVSATDGRRGLLLPDLPGIDTVEQQISICQQKAGISPSEPVSYQTFTVERHKDFCGTI
jgi:AmmeMemoRadiSam system protein A